MSSNQRISLYLLCVRDVYEGSRLVFYTDIIHLCQPVVLLRKAGGLKDECDMDTFLSIYLYPPAPKAGLECE